MGYMTTKLTPRQREVLGLWLDGVPYRDLAAQLGISPETVNPHLKGIARKLGVKGISRATLSEAWTRECDSQALIGSARA